MNMYEELKKAITQIPSQFKTNELAYLALTSKIELPIRDKLAYILFNQLHDKGNLSEKYLVARELKRIDLAILKDTKPVVLIEAKAAYTFNFVCPKKEDFPCQDMKSDVKKRFDDIQQYWWNDSKNIEIYNLLIVVNPKKKISQELVGIIKYDGGVNKALSYLGNADAVAEDANKKLENRIKFNFSIPIIDAGEAYGIPVEISLFLIGPHTSEDGAPLIN